MIKFLKPKQLQLPLVYLKNLPLHLDHKAMQRLRLAGQFLGMVLLTTFITFIFLNNMTPFGLTVHYELGQKDNAISSLTPKDRVKEELVGGEKTVHQMHDLVYFTTKMPFLFDNATVRVTFHNPNPDQTLSLGFQDQAGWHYDTQLLDVPFLNSLPWNTIGKNPVLYQREPHFISVEQFLDTPSPNALIGTYNYDTDIGDISQTKLSDYIPQTQETIIDTPLRGRHVFYTYLANEPFKMIIEKQDLNWYEDPDPVTIKIYKGRAIVYQVVADDDGIVDKSQKVLPPQQIDISNPGPELPENGVYKIVIDANSDTIIRSITTNLHKIVFAGTLFPAANAYAYPGVTSITRPTTLFTNALPLSAITYHTAGKQSIQVGDELFPVRMLNSNEIFMPKQTFTKIVIPKNDIILNGFQGYFSFSENQFFLPTHYHILPITKKEDLELVDYVLADYQPSKKIGDWQIAKQTFDIRSAFIKNGRLSWLIKAPRLKENDHEIIIKDIEITFHKKSWL